MLEASAQAEALREEVDVTEALLAGQCAGAAKAIRALADAQAEVDLLRAAVGRVSGERLAAEVQALPSSDDSSGEFCRISLVDCNLCGIYPSFATPCAW